MCSYYARSSQDFVHRLNIFLAFTDTIHLVVRVAAVANSRSDTASQHLLQLLLRSLPLHF